MKIELINCEAALLTEIAEPESTRDDVASTYGLALRSSEHETMDWQKINRAILDRWSAAALQYVKRLAWKGRG